MSKVDIYISVCVCVLFVGVYVCVGVHTHFTNDQLIGNNQGININR